jgi:uncharacterized protein YciI
VTRELESYTFVLLRRPADAPDFSDEELDRLQEGHLAFLDRMRERGAMLVSGPFDDQPDESLRGFSIYRTSIEETRELLRNDPALKANRMTADVFTWWTTKGSVAFPLASAESGSS